ncbi:MAG: hypothetical protein K8T20_00415 [Planctomycetes bacterium]|nr:hypothetical protein [Planctomycetota bacterium]
MRRLLAIFALLSVPAFAGDPSFEAPESASWARFKPGAWCRTRTVFPRDNGVKVTIERREELVRVKATEYELKSEWVKDGVHEDLNLGTHNRQIDETEWSKSDKKEDVEVDGKKEVSCVVTQTVRENGDSQFSSTKWTSLDVPGGVVKEEEKETSKGQDPRISTVELLEFEGELAAPAGK